MSGAQPSQTKLGLGLRRFAPVAWVALAWLGAWFSGSGELRSSPHAWEAIFAFLDRFVFKAFGGFPAAQAYARDFVLVLEHAVLPTLWVYASWATFLVPLGFVARIMARAWIRSGGRDPIDRLRTWQRAHPAVWATLLGILPAVWGFFAFKVLYGNLDVTRGAVAPLALASAVFEYVAARATFRAFLQPTVDPEEETRIEIGADEIVFDAVAVTREARAAVAGLAGLSLVMVVWLAALPILTLFRDPRLFAAVAAYVAIAATSAAVFRAASRVAVGVDGVLVKGTSRTRFYAYRDLHDVRVSNGDIELWRRGGVVLRLQLHGADAIRRDAVAARIRENIARVQRGEHAVAAQLVASSSQEALTRVASGGADYRAATLSREALWALIEGPTVDSESRRAAAEALAKTSDAGERERLRVAAEHCADPRVRVAMIELAEVESVAGAGGVEAARTAART